MKLSYAVLAGAAVLFLASCASAPAPAPVAQAPAPAKPAAEESDAPFASLYNKVTDLRKTGVVVDVGIGIDKGGRFDLALQKAQLDGQAKVAAAFETKVEALRKNFAETLSGSSSDTQELNETFQSVTKAVVQKTLNGVQTIGAPRQLKDGTQVTVGVLVGIDPKAVDTSLLNELKGKDSKLYERFRASQGFADLQKEMDNYDKSSGTTPAAPAASN